MRKDVTKYKDDTKYCLNCQVETVLPLVGRIEYSIGISSIMSTFENI